MRKPVVKEIDDTNDTVEILESELRQMKKDLILLRAARDAGVFEDPKYAAAIDRIAKNEYHWHLM